MSYALEAMERVKAGLRKLPGVGPRSAERMAFHLLKADAAEVLELADALSALKQRVRNCQVCFNLSETDVCPICADPRRQQGLIFVVEQPKDLMLLEASGSVRGVYHCLLGRINPLEGLGPEDLTIDALAERVAAGGVDEVVLALNPTVEGDATALVVADRLATSGVQITRLARGLASGSALEFANRSTLQDAIETRRAF